MVEAINQEDMEWLEGIGISPINISKIASRLDISLAIAELRENIDDYKLIFKNEKYIMEMLRMYQGLIKLKRLRIFYQNYNKINIPFSESQLVGIVSGAGWEEKLETALAEPFTTLLASGELSHYQLTESLKRKDWLARLRSFGITLTT